MNRRVTSDAAVVVGICCAAGAAALVARGVGFVFWVIVALAAAVLIGSVLLWLLELSFDASVAPLADRYRDWRAERREARSLPHEEG